MITTILFDVDGVLLDSLKANRQWYCDVLSHFGYTGPTDEQMPQHHGLPAVEVLREYAPGASESTTQDIMAYGDTVESDPALLVVPNRAPKTVEGLARRYPLALVTSRTRLHMQELFQFYDKDWFQADVVEEDTKRHKPDPEPLLLGARRLHIQPQECVYIGDMQSDVEAGHAAGMKVIIFSKNKISGADAQTEDFEEIPNLIKMLD